MSRDYSEYNLTEYDKYRMRRSNSKDIRLDYFQNNVLFVPEEKRFIILVDDSKEYEMMEIYTEDFKKEEAAKEGKEYQREQLDEKTYNDCLEDTQKWFSIMKSKYNFTADHFLGFVAEEEGKVENIAINVLSGALINVNYGEGILDFIYADFLTPLKEQLRFIAFEELLRDALRTEKNMEQTPEVEYVEPVPSEMHKILLDFQEYEQTFFDIKEVAYASLYTAICPPVFSGTLSTAKKRLNRYGNYLLELQKEYREIIEFCYDEDFYPEILGKKYPSERFAIYKAAHNLPSVFGRREEMLISNSRMGGKEMPFGAPVEVILNAHTNWSNPLTEKEKEFGEKIGLTGSDLLLHLRHPFFMSINYEFGTISEMLELELTKMFEQNVRFRKCKRCGKYFIMKGNYDTKYCDRIAEGETRNCQEIAAIENYKAKIADDKAIPIYNKYYKRYAARVKVRQIKEADFKKWKYQAMIKRDECSAGTITPEEYTEWMEAAFPNRTGKK